MTPRTFFFVSVFFSCVTCALSQAPSRTTNVPPSQPATRPASQPTTTQAAKEQKREAEITEEMAEQTGRQAETKLRKIRKEKEKAEQETDRDPFSPQAREKLERLEIEAAFEESRKTLSTLRQHYAEQLRREAETREALEARRNEADATFAQIDKMTPDQRREKADQLDALMAEADEAALGLQSVADAENAKVADHQKRQNEWAQQVPKLEAAPASQQREERLAQLRRDIEQAERLIANQRLVAYAIADQAANQRAIAGEYRREAGALRAANQKFWIENAYLLNIARILAVTIAINMVISILVFLAAKAASAFASRVKRDGAPNAKRIHTLIYFTRSIAKLLVWIFAVVTILAEFGISPGQSAGALGVIGLVLAGMFQQLVVDFVKGIDIAAGGHYYIGDFIQVGDKAGHVLDIRVKYTTLRTPSGQILHLPNSQCIPSRRFPAGHVDNYVDVPLPKDADQAKARTALADVGRLLNEQVEAVKQTPEYVSSSSDGTTLFIRTRVRVLPTCDWVLTDRYIPMVKRRFEAENIPLAGDPSFFHINNVDTFRRLFSRQLSESDIAHVAEQEAQPTVVRPDLADPDAPPTPDADIAPRGPVDLSNN